MRQGGVGERARAPTLLATMRSIQCCEGLLAMIPPTSAKRRAATLGLTKIPNHSICEWPVESILFASREAKTHKDYILGDIFRGLFWDMPDEGPSLDDVLRHQVLPPKAVTHKPLKLPCRMYRVVFRKG